MPTLYAYFCWIPHINVLKDYRVILEKFLQGHSIYHVKDILSYYLRQGGYVFVVVCLFVC